MNVWDVLRRPLITEKNTRLGEDRQYMFVVDRRANKTQVKEAVERAFNVKVQAVNTMNAPAKARTRNLRRQGRVLGERSGYKKAIVTLEPGNSTEFFEGI
jgi:large subunit ribosomal protein L23